MVGHNPHHIKNSEDFARKISDLEVPPGISIVSFDVTALFTSIPVDEAVKIIGVKLDEDNSWESVTTLCKEQILELLKFCLNTTYFVFRGSFYKQKHGAAMGSPISPIVANLFMEHFEQHAISSAKNPPLLWYRYVDDTFVKIHEYYVEEFKEHINNINPFIKFTIEYPKDDSLPFLDTRILVKEDGSTSVSVYRKPTHTDQYLQFGSNHHLQHKRSVVRTLLHRAETIVSEEEDKHQEIEHVKDALRDNGYKSWMFKPPTKKGKHNDYVVNVSLPYVHGLSEKLSNIFRNHGVGTYHVPGNTLRQLLVHPKDKSDDMKKCGAIYKITCPECSKTYIGETARSLESRTKEHLNLKTANFTAVAQHCMDSLHHITASDVEIVARENKYWRRKIRESVEIMWENPPLNRDSGYDLAPIYRKLKPHTTNRGRNIIPETTDRGRTDYVDAGNQRTEHQSNPDDEPEMGSKA